MGPPQGNTPIGPTLGAMGFHPSPLGTMKTVDPPLSEDSLGFMGMSKPIEFGRWIQRTSASMARVCLVEASESVIDRSYHAC
eukprot:scaffold615_cov387-Pavlova_lutheri.AAC.6